MTAPGRLPLSVVIPAYRESARITATISEILDFFDSSGIPIEVIVADDGSDDATVRLILEAASAETRVRLVSLDRHRGKGAAVREGILAARGERILVSDADLAIPLEEYGAFAAALDEGADGAVASKELGRREGFVAQPFLRTIMGRVFNFLVRLLVLPGYLDTQAGFKLLRGDAAKILATRSRLDGFAYDVEMLALARVEGMKIRELPVHCRLTGGTSVRVLRDSFRMLRDLAAIRGSVRALRRRENGDAGS